jgi:manganese transport protein
MVFLDPSRSGFVLDPTRALSRVPPARSERFSLSERTVAAARQVLEDRRLGWRRYLAFAGPAIVASIAFMDPGNVATNVQAGARYGYSMLWVVLLANLVAMLFQSLSAKLGIVTGRNLAEMCRKEFPRPIVLAMWVVSEIAAMATDLAEFLGGAIGLSLLFHIPLLGGMVVTAVIVYAILLTEKRGFRLARAHHRRPRRRDCPLLSHRIVYCAGRLGFRRASYGGTVNPQ